MNWLSKFYLLTLKENPTWKHYTILSILAFQILEEKGQQVTECEYDKMKE